MPFEPRNARYEKEKKHLFGRDKQTRSKDNQLEETLPQQEKEATAVTKKTEQSQVEVPKVDAGKAVESQAVEPVVETEALETKTETETKPTKQSKPKKAKPEKKPKRSRTGFYTFLVIVVVLALGLGSFGGYYYVKATNYTAVNAKDTTKVNVHIEQGSNAQQIGQLLTDKKLVHSPLAFKHYIETHEATNLRAGYYVLSKSMNMKKIVETLLTGGSDVPLNDKHVLTMTEGEGIATFAKKVGASKKFTEQEFLAAVNDQDFLDRLAKKYPKLLKSAMTATDVRYRLEGYLYPATYNYDAYKNVNELIVAMVDKTNTEMQPYYAEIAKKKMTVQEVMTVASIIQGEGVGDKNMRIISGVFFNRLAINMPIQSDVAVKYALNTDKVNLTVDDVNVDSPYNLYKNPGFGPGPFNNPSIQAVKAVLNPLDRDKKYLYFVANLKTGAITYSTNQEDHDAAVAKVDAINQAMENSSSSSN